MVFEKPASFVSVPSSILSTVVGHWLIDQDQELKWFEWVANYLEASKHTVESCKKGREGRSRECGKRILC